jgi:transposase-like protein
VLKIDFTYPPEFRREVLRLVRSAPEERHISRIAKELGIFTETLRNPKSRTRAALEGVKSLLPRRRNCVNPIKRTSFSSKGKRSSEKRRWIRLVSATLAW